MERTSMKPTPLLLTITILWMLLIFLFSAQLATDSETTSHFVGDLLASTFVRGYENWEIVRQEQLVEGIDFFVRKSAHAFEYAVLCVLLVLTIRKYKKTSGFVSAFGITFLYSISDEIHQIFVPGRAGRITDVMIDMLGAAVGMLLLKLCFYLRIRTIRKRKLKHILRKMNTF